MIFLFILVLFFILKPTLRQIVYLAIKELSGLAEDVLMITASITKDVNGKADAIYRPNAIRALCKVLDPSMIQGVERLIKQAIVDKNPSVSSAAIISSFHFFQSNKEVVRRWANEVTEAMTSRTNITQYHALGLLYLIRQHDRVATVKLVQSLAKTNMRSPLAYCMLIRYTYELINHEEPGNRSLFSVLEAWLRNRSEMVAYEAARAICNLDGVTTSELAPAIAALRIMLSNPRQSIRFAAIRTLERLSTTHAEQVSSCNLDIEPLVGDPNRSIATFAITTLLKTGKEWNVDRLLKQISGMMNDITDEFKILIIDAIRALCLKFPTKQASTFIFLSNVLRDEGSYEYKRAIVEAIFDIVYNVPESKEAAFTHLCEFIEDCEFSKLVVRILHLLGSEGPKALQPAKYIRFIYNRVILENATVRAAAVSALASFAEHCPDLRDRILVLLTRCLDDPEDEVRDRAILYLKLIGNDELCNKYLDNENSYNWAILENSLLEYRNKQEFDEPFDINVAPTITKEEEQQERARQIAEAKKLDQTVNAKTVGTEREDAQSSSVVDNEVSYQEKFSKIPQLAAVGKILNSSKPVQLSELETEYVVSCVKHIVKDYIIFQFNIRNTIPETVLDNIVPILIPTYVSDPEEAIEILSNPYGTIKTSSVSYGTPGTAYVVFRRPENIFPSATFNCKLKFINKEIDPETKQPEEDGYEDEYAVEDIELKLADYISPRLLFNTTAFTNLWDELTASNESIETYELSHMHSILEAVTETISTLGLSVVANTDQIKERAVTHTLLLSGTFVGDVPVLVRCRLALNNAEGIAMELAVRSTEHEISERIASL